jgi:hypothetical protein
MRTGFDWLEVKVQEPARLQQLSRGQCSDKHAFEVSVASNGHRHLWPVLLLFVRFSTIFKDAASKTGQNQGCHQEEKQAGRSAPRRRASSDTTGPFCS